MKAIMTKYIGPTNTRPARVKADAGSGCTFTVSWDSALDTRQNHAAVARALCDKMGWKGGLIGGGFPSGDMAWVFADSRDRA